MGMGKRWTKSEDRKLLKYVKEGKPLGEIALLLDRPAGGIKYRLVQTHGKRVRPKRAYSTRTYKGINPWTEVENLILKGHDTATSDELVGILKARGFTRTAGEIRKQWNLLLKVMGGEGSTKFTQAGGMPAKSPEVKKDDPLVELLKKLVATQEEHTKLIKRLMGEVLEVKDSVKASTANAQLIKLNQIMGLLAANHTPLNRLGAGEKLVMMIPDEGDFSTVVKSDRVIIKRVD